MTKLLLALLKLVPYIAAGISVIHSDLSAGHKSTIATDLIADATAASQEVLSGDKAQMAATIGATAQSSVSTIINAIHGNYAATN